MKKTILILLATILVLCSTMPLSANASSNDSPSRQINVVYDDSGSMYSSGGSNVDTWCRAKYSMEVFAAMLGERDRMHVYYMSDYQDGQSKPARLQLDGKDGAAENVKKVHDETTHAGNTPFSSVKKAYKDLQSANAEEKWLVILTDGAFQGVSGQEGMDSFFGQKDDNIGVIFLGIGADVPGITEHHDKDIYCFKASDSRAVLENITQICTIVFNSNKLVVNPSTKTFSFDIPVGELVVFAQGGENVRISGIKNGSQEYGSSKAPVEVKYSPCDAVGRNNQPVTDLHGFLAVFIDDFMPGNYTVEVSGAETVEVYYKPNIDIAVSLTDSSGREVMGLSEIEAGEYTLDMCFVKAGTNERINNSSLLGDVSFDAAVTKNGVLLDQVFHSGDKITAEEGSMIIDVTARYLTYYSLSSVKNFSVYKDNHVSFSVVDDPTFDVNSNGIDPEKYILIHADIDGHTPTKEQWDKMELPIVKLTSGQGEYDIDTPVLVKGSNPGDLMLYPKLSGTNPTEGTYGNFGYSLSYDQSIGEERWSGSLEGVAKLNDTSKTNNVSFSVNDNPSYIVNSDGFDSDKYILVSVKINGETPTKEQWEIMDTPVAQLSNEYKDFRLDSLVVEKTAEPGFLRIYPKLPGGKPTTGTYRDSVYTLNLNQTTGKVNWIGSMEGTLKLSDTRSWFERNWDLFVKLAILIAILIVLAGYLPIFKHYLPKALKKKPYIKCVPSKPGEKRKDRNGLMEKNLISTIIPYVAQTGTIKVVPKGVTGAPALKVRGIRRRRMTITNIRAYQGKDYITFDGESIKKDCTKFETGAGLTVKVKKNDWTYTCTLNQ